MRSYESSDEYYDAAPIILHNVKPDRVRSIELQRDAARKIYEERTAELDAELARVTRRLEVAEALGGETDPFIDDTDSVVLLVEMTFTRNPEQVYTYACLRTGGRWYTTQVAPAQGMTWAQFIAWLTKDGRNVVGILRLRKSGKRLV